MADEVREIRFNFAADVRDLIAGSDAVASGMRKAAGETSLAGEAVEYLGSVGKQAAVDAAEMAIDWLRSSVDIALEARKTAKVFDETFGPAAGRLNDEIEELAGHMGLAEHEASQLLATAGMLAQSMGMGKDESAAFAENMFRLAGDMAAFNPNVGDASDAMDDLLRAANGSTKGMAEWGVSLKSAEINARALEMTGKTSAITLTQQEKAMATLSLVTEKQADAQGALNEKIESGSTKYKESNADLEDMQAEIGEGLVPVYRAWLEVLVVLVKGLGGVINALQTLGKNIAWTVFGIMKLIEAVKSWAAAFTGLVSGAINTVIGKLQAVGGWITRTKDKLASFASGVNRFNPFSSNFGNFHSGGTVPGAKGNPVPIIAQGGETIGRPGSAASGPTTVVNISVESGLSNPMETAREIANLLESYTASTGPVNIKVK